MNNLIFFIFPICVYITVINIHFSLKEWFDAGQPGSADLFIKLIILIFFGIHVRELLALLAQQASESTLTFTLGNNAFYRDS